MSEGSVTEVTSQSWFSRLGGAFKGILVGIVMIGVAFWLLFWNEGRAVNRARALKEGAGVVASVATDPVLAANEGKLVHFSGQSMTSDVLRDEAFGVASNSIHLERQVEMYQWKELEDRETRKKVGGGTESTTTYSYSRSWSSSLVGSDRFKQPSGHENPSHMPYESRTLSAENVTVGGFRLSAGLIQAIRAYEPLRIESIDSLPSKLRWKARLHDGGVYLGMDPANPQVGDTRISFRRVNPAVVSVVAQQVGNGAIPYKTSGGGSIELLSMGTENAEAMFESAKQANKTLSWVFRVIGFFVMTFGLKMLFRPFTVMADVVPAFGNLMEALSGWVAYGLAAALSMGVIAVAWLYHRPLLGVTILILGTAFLVLSVMGVVKLMKRSKAAQSAL